MTANSIVFILSIIMTVFVTLNSLRTVTGLKVPLISKNTDIADRISFIITVIALIAGAFDLFSTGFLGLTNYYFTLAFYMAVSIYLASVFKDAKSSEKSTEFLVFFFKSFTVLMLCELFVFNFNSYHIIFGDYPQKYISSENTEITVDETTTYDVTYSFKDIDEYVGNLTVDAEIEGSTSEFMFEIGVSDESSEPVRAKIGKIWAIPEYAETYTAPMHFTGKVSEITVKVYLPEDQDMTLKGIMINRVIPVRFSYVRFGLMMGGLVFAYFLLKGRNMTSEVSQNRRFFRMTVNVITASAMILMTFMLATSYMVDDGLYELFHMETGDQMTQDLVDAFASGHTYMTFEPTEEILSMENPYDTNKRSELGLAMNVDYAWDHLLYEGKYYSYYGIAPVILLFLPYYLITGYYFPAVIAVYIFSMIGIFALSRVYIQFIERWFGSLKSGMALAGMIIMLASCGVWFSMARPHFYETAISAGFACVCSGAYFLITSNIFDVSSISLKRLSLSSVLLSLGVLSRPTTAVYCICACIFIAMGYKKAKGQFGGKASRYLLSAFIPYVVIGSVQMIYNYVRFSSPFDFGIQYSLTINDFTKSQYHTQFVFVTIFNFIFNAPGFEPDFPFVKSSFQALDTNGYYYKDAHLVNAVSVGLIYRALPVISYLMTKKAYNMSQSENKKKTSVIISLLSIAAPLVILFSIWESGYAVRYTADFSWQILIGAYVILFTVMTKCSSKEIKKILYSAFVFSMFFSCVVDFAQIYSFTLEKGTSLDYEGMLYMFGRLFEFWK